jgi:integrase
VPLSIVVCAPYAPAVGSIARLSNRPSRPWRARYRAPDGRERSATFARKIDAERWLREQLSGRDRGAWLDPALGRTTVAEWSERWLKARGALKPSTLAEYESRLRCLIVPYLGDVQLRGLDTIGVEEWVAHLAASGLSPSRVRSARTLLSSMLTTAVRSGYVGRNAAEGVAVPRDRRREMLFLDAGQLLDLADTIDRCFRLLVLVLAYAGLRWGEAAAMRRGRVDLLRRRLEVVESLAEVVGQLHFGPTKTYQERWVTMPRFLVESLAAHLESVSSGSGSLVFTAAGGRPLRRSNFGRRVWRPAVLAAGLPDQLRVHDLRHTCAALLIADGANPKMVQAHLGHSSIQVTLDRYGHLFPSDIEAMAAGLDAVHARAVAARAAGTQRAVLEIDHRR